MGHRHNRKRTRSRSRTRTQTRANSPDLASEALFAPPPISMARSAYVPRIYEPFFTPAAPAAVLAAASLLSHTASQSSASSQASSSGSAAAGREFLLRTSFKHQSLCKPAHRRGQQDGWVAAHDSVRFLFDGDTDFVDAPI